MVINNQLFLWICLNGEHLFKGMVVFGSIPNLKELNVHMVALEYSQISNIFQLIHVHFLNNIRTFKDTGGRAHSNLSISGLEVSS